ncbi:MAG: radical SAM protein [Pseudomonadota bacterium]
MVWAKTSDDGGVLRATLRRHGEMRPGQTAGRFWPVACVALEVTQRCNLDCTLCYLSEHAEAAHDVPLRILLERVDAVAAHYGVHTTIQITGGDPTLRPVEDLACLCRHIRARGLRSCLMTNGIRARREMLARLADAGLDDVAFHVDLTQERANFPSEAALNAVRSDYLDRAEGLGLRVLFNTTVFDGNLRELPAVARFFRAEAGRIALVSFQLQTATGRGVLGGGGVTKAAVADALEEGFGTPLSFGVAEVGHRDCTRYAALLVAGESAVSALTNRGLFGHVLAAMERHARHSGAYVSVLPTLRAALVRHPALALRVLGEVSRKLWRLRRGLWHSRGRMSRMTVLLHDFMAEDALEAARCESCVFMVATPSGPVSMCEVNAARDHHVFAPTALDTTSGRRWWSAATGAFSTSPTHLSPSAVPQKRLKGRARAAKSGKKL